MSKRTKVWLWIAIAAVVAGLILFGVVMSMAGWDFMKLSTVQYETNTYEIEEDFQKVWIDTLVANVTLLPHDEDVAKVVCYESEGTHHDVLVKDGTLVILAVGTGKWTDNIGINFDSMKIRVYLPKREYSELFVKAKTGDINCFVSAKEKITLLSGTGDIFAEKVTAGAMEISVSTGTTTIKDVTCENEIKASTATGRINVMNVQCKSFTSEGSTGDITMEWLVAQDRIYVRRSTGSVKFDRCNAWELIQVEVNTGDVRGSFLMGKKFSVRTGTGSVDVPESTEGSGECRISTQTGNVRITIEEGI